jgi:hypothetical protein
MCQCTGTEWYGDRCQNSKFYNMMNINISFSYLECPERISGNAFGLSDSMFPLDCQLTK